MKDHQYEIKVEWTGDLGEGTKDYKSYSRNHSIKAEGKYSEILGSSDPSFLGDKSKYNPEDLFLSSLSSCHMLWYLHLCTVNKIVILSYIDNAIGIMQENQNGSGQFREVVLQPIVTIENKEMIPKAIELHKEANKMCFIANSCNFEISHEPQVLV